MLQQHSRLQKPHSENFWTLNEGCKCYLGNKEKKATLLVVSQSDVQFGFDDPFFCMPDRTRK